MAVSVKFNRDLAKFTKRQLEAVEALKSGECKFLLYGGALGGGKGASLNSEIITPFGIRRMGDLKVGDTIFGRNGGHQKVIAIHPLGQRDLYRMTFNDGASTLCTLDHLWLINKTQRHRKKKHRGFDPVLGEMFFGGEIWTTEMVKQWLEQKQAAAGGSHIKKQNLLIPLCEPVSFTKSYKSDPKRGIHPYLLGVLIGDGTLTTTTPLWNKPEPEIADRVASFGYSVNACANDVYSVVGHPEIKDALVRLGLCGKLAPEKFIPDCFKYAVVEDRKFLVQGMMDTDGTVDQRGHCSYSTSSRQLAKDFQWMIRSLGGKATVQRKPEPKYTYDGKQKIGQPAYIVHFRTKIDPELVWLPRKRKLTTATFNNGLGELSRAIVSLEYECTEEAQCITVSNPDGLYLAEDFIVTHNSYFLRWYAVRRLLELAMMGNRNVTGMLACEDYPALKDRQLQKIEVEFPSWLGKQHSDHKVYGRSFILAPDYGSGVVCFRNLDQPAKYQSSEWAFILVDELTKNVYETFTFLRTRLRWPGIPDDQCFFIGATNPGGVGHGWVKSFWMDKTFPPEFYEPVDYTVKFHYVPAKADDNPHLDEAYWAMLNTLPENLRAAFRDGDWDIFVGQAFPEFTQTYHVEKPKQVPDFARLYMTYDFGFGAPYSCGYWWVDEDGRLHRFAELYGAVPGGNNHGLRQADSEQAEKIKAFENTLGVGLWDESGNAARPITRYCDPTCFNKKPDYKGGGQGPATAEIFRSYGIEMVPGDPHRHLKKRQFHERLRVRSELDPETGDQRIIQPMMVVSSDCKDFIRTIPNLQIDENDIEDVADGEDHCLCGDTEVVTSSGPVKIKHLVGKKGVVLTAGGLWTTFYNCRKTIENTKTVEVVFEDGRSIACTPDHRFLTNKGLWVEARDLTDEACHVSMPFNINYLLEAPCELKSLTKRHKSLMGNATGCACTQSKTIMERGSLQCTTEQGLGTKATRAALGIGSNTKSTAKWQSRLQKEQGGASFVGRSLPAPNIKNTVQGNASSEAECSDREKKGFVPSAGLHILDSDALVQKLVLQSSHGKSVKVVEVRSAGDRDVYCLDAAITHAFAVAGGIVVHNCYDEAALMLMARPLALNKEEEKERAEKEKMRVARNKLDSTSKQAWDNLDELRQQYEDQSEAERDAFSDMFEGF